MKKASRIKGGLYGLLIGDALGVPYEFHSPADIPPRDRIEMVAPAGFRRAHPTVKPGTWSDDGALALCLLDSLLVSKKLDLADLATRFLMWAEKGYMAVDSRVFDIGIQTSRALDNLRRGIPPYQAGPADVRNNGNGSLMRALPLALWHEGLDEELVELAHQQSLVTHGHIHSQVSCALYVLVGRHLLRGASMSDAWAMAETLLPTFYTDKLQWEAFDNVMGQSAGEVKGSGYVVDSLWSAKKACQEQCYEQVVRAAIALGNDTDTTACIAGGLAGICFGFESIPERWVQALRGKEAIHPLEVSLLAMTTGQP